MVLSQQASVSKEQGLGNALAEMHRLDPALAEHLANTHLSPRVAAVCLMHQLAQLVHQDGTTTPAQMNHEDDAAAAGERSAWTMRVLAPPYTCLCNCVRPFFC